MEKEILAQITSLLEKSKEEQLGVLIALFIGIVLLNLLLAIYTSRVVDKYRNSLKRQEVKFSVYNQIQIKKLSELFEIAHEMKCACSAVSRIVEEDLVEEFDAAKLEDCHERMVECFSKSRYIFPEDIKKHFFDGSKELSDFRFNSALLSSKYKILNYSDYKENPSDGEENLDLIAKHIGNYRFDKGVLQAMIFCETLKVKIEEHFKDWE